MVLKMYFLSVAILFAIFIGVIAISYKNGLIKEDNYTGVEDLLEKYIWLSMLFSVAWPVFLVVILFYGLIKSLSTLNGVNYASKQKSICCIGSCYCHV